VGGGEGTGEGEEGGEKRQAGRRTLTLDKIIGTNKNHKLISVKIKSWKITQATIIVCDQMVIIPALANPNLEMMYGPKKVPTTPTQAEAA
jgi:hypothetical protein